MKRQIFFAPAPDPKTLNTQDTFTIQINEEGQITGDLCTNTTDLLQYLKETAGIETEALIDFCG